MTALTYRTGNDIDLDQVLDLYVASTLGRRRPVEDHSRMQLMLAHANLVISAWDGSELVGIARSMTDFSYVAYLADLAVRVSHQRQGIGRELIRRTRCALHPDASIVLLAAPAATEYYPHLDFERHPAAFVLPGPKSLG